MGFVRDLPQNTTRPRVPLSAQSPAEDSETAASLRGLAQADRLDVHPVAPCDDGRIVGREGVAMHQRTERLNRMAIMPIPLLVLAMVALWVADVRIVWSLSPLTLLVHYGSMALGVAFIVIPAARGFLANGQPSVLMLGCGILMMDVAVVATAAERRLDTVYAIYNTSTLLGALCHFAGVAITSRAKSVLRAPPRG